MAGIVYRNGFSDVVLRDHITAYDGSDLGSKVIEANYFDYSITPRKLFIHLSSSKQSSLYAMCYEAVGLVLLPEAAKDRRRV